MYVLHRLRFPINTAKPIKIHQNIRPSVLIKIINCNHASIVDGHWLGLVVTFQKYHCVKASIIFRTITTQHETEHIFHKYAQFSG